MSTCCQSPRSFIPIATGTPETGPEITCSFSTAQISQMKRACKICVQLLNLAHQFGWATPVPKILIGEGEHYFEVVHMYILCDMKLMVQSYMVIQKFHRSVQCVGLTLRDVYRRWPKRRIKAFVSWPCLYPWLHRHLCFGAFCLARQGSPTVPCATPCWRLSTTCNINLFSKSLLTTSSKATIEKHDYNKMSTL